MISLDGDKVGFKTTYLGYYCYHDVLKLGKDGQNFKPDRISIVSNVSNQKNKDVEKLLMKIDAFELVLQFYINALSKCVVMNGEGRDNELSDEDVQ